MSIDLFGVATMHSDLQDHDPGLAHDLATMQRRRSSIHGVVDALLRAGIVRSDIRGSIAGVSGTATGVPLTLRLNLVDVAAGCGSLAG